MIMWFIIFVKFDEFKYFWIIWFEDESDVIKSTETLFYMRKNKAENLYRDTIEFV